LLKLNAAPHWSISLVFDRNFGALEGPQRTIALWVAAAYKTVSSDVALVVSSLIPVHLQARERMEIYRARMQAIAVDLAMI